MGEVQIENISDEPGQDRISLISNWLRPAWTMGWLLVFVLLAAVASKNWQPLVDALTRAPQPTSSSFAVPPPPGSAATQGRGDKR
jgi:hypothetical protein